MINRFFVVTIYIYIHDLPDVMTVWFILHSSKNVLSTLLGTLSLLYSIVGYILYILVHLIFPGGRHRCLNHWQESYGPKVTSGAKSTVTLGIAHDGHVSNWPGIERSYQGQRWSGWIPTSCTVIILNTFYHLSMMFVEWKKCYNE